MDESGKRAFRKKEEEEKKESGGTAVASESSPARASSGKAKAKKSTSDAMHHALPYPLYRAKEKGGKTVDVHNLTHF